MARPLPLNEEIYIAEETRCELCGAVLSSDGPDRTEHSDVEVVRRLAMIAADAIVILLYTAYPNATIADISARVRIGRTEVCEARERAAEMYPALASILALCTPRANAQRARRASEETQPLTPAFL
jgi:hypothetical protein